MSARLFVSLSIAASLLLLPSYSHAASSSSNCSEELSQCRDDADWIFDNELGRCDGMYGEALLECFERQKDHYDWLIKRCNSEFLRCLAKKVVTRNPNSGSGAAPNN